MVNYKSLGLVNTREMFKRAINGGWAVPAFNFNNLEQLQAIIKATSELKSPVILQVSKGARNYANQTLLRYMAEGAVEYAKELGCNHPEIALHLDHGDSFELCKNCVDMGFSSVMIDGSSLPYDENVALTKQVVDYAHQYDVTVEGELGVLAGVEDEVASEVSHYTKPEEVIDFTTKTGVDSLAISIGTSHGAYKFKPEQCTRNADGILVPPPLRFDILEAIEKAGYVPGKDFMLAMDAASSEWKSPKGKGFYKLPKAGTEFTSSELIAHWKSLVEKYPIISIEDGLDEEDWEGWQEMTRELGGKVQLVGDDLFVTNTERLAKGIQLGAGNAILIKLNQIGSVSETLEAIKMAHKAGYTAISSHRSGETEDTTIADLAVALNTCQIKTGAPSRTERVAKYNQLLRIEEQLGGSAVYPGMAAFNVKR